MSHDTRYEIILYWSEEDQAVIAEVTEWIETAQELGRAIPQPKGRLMYA
jgi:predicted RNase H-like HicB family nuclease